MAVKLRLSRMGMKKKPFYRIVAVDGTASRNGKNLEILGTYDPMTEPASIRLHKEKIDKWIKLGGTPTKTVEDIFKKHYFTTKA